MTNYWKLKEYRTYKGKRYHVRNIQPLSKSDAWKEIKYHKRIGYLVKTHKIKNGYYIYARKKVGSIL